jgi:hypothetical protein
MGTAADPRLIHELELLGIKMDATKWRRLSDCASPQIFACYVVCWCAGRPRQVSMAPVEWNGRRILVTQCPDCREEIVWCFWRVDGKWTGTREITVTEIAEAGSCARASPTDVRA